MQMAARGKKRLLERAMTAWQTCMAEAKNERSIADAFAGYKLSKMKPALPYFQAWQQRILYVSAKRKEDEMVVAHAQRKQKQKAFDGLVQEVHDSR